MRWQLLTLALLLLGVLAVQGLGSTRWETWQRGRDAMKGQP